MFLADISFIELAGGGGRGSNQCAEHQKEGSVISGSRKSTKIFEIDDNRRKSMKIDEN